MPRLDRDPEELRFRAARRWGPRLRWACVYCGKKPANQIDHFVPYWQTADSRPANLVPACQRCNHEKRDRQPAEWMKAVGVDPQMQELLLKLQMDKTQVIPSTLAIPRTNLDYAAGKPLKGKPRAVSG